MLIYWPVERTRVLRYDEVVKISKADLPDVPSGFHLSWLSLPLRAKRVYRDNRRTDSLQLREYDDYWTIQRDRFNPETGLKEFVLHALTDARHITAFGVLGCAGILGFLALFGE